MQPRFVYWKQQWLRTEKANVGIDDRSFRYGDGCFETIKVRNGKVLQWEAHWQRLSAGLKTLRMTLPAIQNAGFWLEKCETLVCKNGHEQCGRIRLTVSRGEGGLYDAVTAFPDVLLQSWPLNESNNRLNENGLDVGVYEDYRKSADVFANLKHNNYLGYAQAALFAREQHWNDALVLNQHGHIADATIANVFLLLEDGWHTPALTEAPVAGTRRGWLLKQMRAAGISVQEEVLRREDLSRVQAAFLSNSIYGVRWVKWLAGNVLPAAPVQQLVKAVDLYEAETRF